MKIIVIHPDNEEAVVQLIGRMRDKDALLDAAGALLVRTSQEAFVKQRFGSIVWPERYAGDTREPFVNVAGIVADFNAGRAEPPQRRFDRRPALMDTGELARSPSYRKVGPDSVEAGSTVPYAALHQRGGESSQPVTRETKERLWGWLKGRREKLRRKVSRQVSGLRRKGAGAFVEPQAASDAGIRELQQHKALMRRLGFLMNKNVTELVTKVHARPFVGVTDRDADEIREMVESHVAGET